MTKKLMKIFAMKFPPKRRPLKKRSSSRKKLKPKA